MPDVTKVQQLAKVPFTGYVDSQSLVKITEQLDEVPVQEQALVPEGTQVQRASSIEYDDYQSQVKITQQA